MKYMETKLTHYAKFLGRKVLHDGKEVILHAVYQSHLLCLNGKPEPYPVMIDECKLICDDENDFFKKNLPTELTVLRDGEGKYVAVVETDLMTDDEKEEEILTEICRCAGVKKEDLRKHTKTRKRELVQARQVHMVIRNKIIRPKESITVTATIYNKDHATYLNAQKRVFAALDGWDIEFREKFREAFELTRSFYKDSADKKLNLKWL